MDEWIIWIILAVVLGVAEIFTLTAALGLLGVAALITAGPPRSGCPCPCNCWSSPCRHGRCCSWSARSRCATSRRRNAAIRRGRAGRQAGLGLVGGDGRGGRVRIGGEEWTARAYDETLVIPAGTTVDVIEIRAPPPSSTPGSDHGNLRS